MRGYMLPVFSILFVFIRFVCKTVLPYLENCGPLPPAVMIVVVIKTSVSNFNCYNLPGKICH